MTSKNKPDTVSSLLLIKDYLLPPLLWTCMFKNLRWLRRAEEIDTTVEVDGHPYRTPCNPLLIGNNLCGFRPAKSNEGLYFVLLSGDYSGDLSCDEEIFFASLRDDYEYDQERQEIKFKSGLTVNVSEVLSGIEEPRLPMRELFPRGKDFQLEYMFLNEASTIQTLTPSNIIGTNGPSEERRDVRYGCALHFPYQGGIIQWIIHDQYTKKKLIVDKRARGVDMRDNCNLIMKFCDPSL